MNLMMMAPPPPLPPPPPHLPLIPVGVEGDAALFGASVREQVRASSVWLKLFLGLVMVIWLMWFISVPLMGVMMPFIFVPTFLLFWRWTKFHTQVDFKNCANNYALAMVPGALLVMIVELVMTLVFAAICFSDQMARVQKCLKDGTCSFDGSTSGASFPIERTLGFYVFVFLLAFASAGGCEETLKYWCMKRGMKNRGVPHAYASHLGILMFVLCAALGFSTIENVGYVSGAVLSTADAGSVIVSLLGRLFISTPLHLLVATLLAIQSIRRDIQGAPLKIWHVMGPSVFFHGGFDFVLLLINLSDLTETTQLVLVIVFVIVWMTLLIGVIVWMIRKYDIHFRPSQQMQHEAPAAGNQDDGQPIRNNLGFQLLPDQDRDEPINNNNNINYAINMPNLQPQQLSQSGVVSANAISQPVPIATPLTQQQWAQYWHSLPPQHQAYLLQQHRTQQPQMPSQV